MKRYFILLIIISMHCFAYGQNCIFKSTDNFNFNESKKVQFDTISISGKLDFDFYRKHFYIPYYYPDYFVNIRFRDTTIVIWSNLNGKKDYTNNWTHTYVIDCQSRVIEYKYSGCIICSQMPYILLIKYDSLNRPVKFEMRMNTLVISHLRKNTLSNKEEKPYEEFEFNWDEQGNLIQINKYEYGTLRRQIIKL